MIQNAQMCKLPAVTTLFEEEVISDDPHQGMNCTIVDENLFDLTAQPFLNSDFITAEEFDELTVDDEGDDENPEQKSETENKVSVVKVKEQKSETENEVSVVKVKEASRELCSSKVEYNCDMCSATCSSHAELTFHVQLHTGVRKFCPYPSCAKTFTTQSGLKHHVTTKHEEYHKQQESEKLKKKKKRLKLNMEQMSRKALQILKVPQNL